MSTCLISSGILVNCDNLRRVGGTEKRFWLLNLDELDKSIGKDGFTFDSSGFISGFIEAINWEGLVGLLKFEGQRKSHSGGWTEIDAGAGNIYYKHDVTVKLLNTTPTDDATIKEISEKDVAVIMETNNGEFLIYGAFNGMRLVEVSQNSGQDPGSDVASLLRFEGKELQLPKRIFTGSYQDTLEMLEKSEKGTVLTAAALDGVSYIRIPYNVAYQIEWCEVELQYIYYDNPATPLYLLSIGSHLYNFMAATFNVQYSFKDSIGGTPITSINYQNFKTGNIEVLKERMIYENPISNRLYCEFNLGVDDLANNNPPFLYDGVKGLYIGSSSTGTGLHKMDVVSFKYWELNQAGDRIRELCNLDFTDNVTRNVATDKPAGSTPIWVGNEAYIQIPI